MNNRNTSVLLINMLANISLAQTSSPPACTGDNRMLTIIDRPSASYSPCTVESKTLYIESGYAYQKLTPSGNGQNLPQIEMRLGLTDHTEIEYLALPEFPWYAQI